MSSDVSCYDIDQMRQHFAALSQFVWHERGVVPNDAQVASVLIPLVLREAMWSILMTRRTEHLRHHPDQISFPGGSQEAQDADAVATALREFQEELGVVAGTVEVLGCLPDFFLPSGFAVTPVVGIVPALSELVPDEFEVAEVFELPLAFVLNESNFQRHRIEGLGAIRQVFALPYRGQFIWGATAGILAMLGAFLRIP